MSVRACALSPSPSLKSPLSVRLSPVIFSPFSLSLSPILPASACMCVCNPPVFCRAQDVPYRADIRESELAGRTQTVPAVREDRVQRAQPLLRALSGQVRVQSVHGRVHPQRYALDALPLQAPGAERVKMMAKTPWSRRRRRPWTDDLPILSRLRQYSYVKRALRPLNIERRYADVTQTSRPGTASKRYGRNSLFHPNPSHHYHHTNRAHTLFCQLVSRCQFLLSLLSFILVSFYSLLRCLFSFFLTEKKLHKLAQFSIIVLPFWTHTNIYYRKKRTENNQLSQQTLFWKHWESTYQYCENAINSRHATVRSAIYLLMWTSVLNSSPLFPTLFGYPALFHRFLWASNHKLTLAYRFANTHPSKM